MPTKSKIRIINVSKKWKTWYIKSKSNTSIFISYCEFLFHIISLFILSVLLCYLGRSLTYRDLPGPPKDHLFLAPCPAEPHLTDQRYHFSLVKKTLNINIASYFLENLASQILKTWHDTEGPITQTINHSYLNHNHRWYVEKTWKKMISSLEKGVNYTVNIVTKKHGRPYLIYSSSEINLISNSTGKRLGLRYTTLLINCNCQKDGDNAVCRSTVNLAYRRLLPKITRVQKIQQGTEIEGKWKESRYLQVKQWLIMLDRLPEEKE